MREINPELQEYVDEALKRDVWSEKDHEWLMTRNLREMLDVFAEVTKSRNIEFIRGYHNSKSTAMTEKALKAAGAWDNPSDNSLDLTQFNSRGEFVGGEE